MPNRWPPVAGGILMNLALGSLYAWSVFVPPLEREFGWARAETSWGYTIAIVCFALPFVGAGRVRGVARRAILGIYDRDRLLRADLCRGRPASGREGTASMRARRGYSGQR